MYYSDSDSDSDSSDGFLDSTTSLVGGTKFAVAFRNQYGTCVLDAILNSLRNSDYYEQKFINELDKNITLKRVKDAFSDVSIRDSTVMSKLITTFDNSDMRNGYIRTLYKQLIGICLKFADNMTPDDSVYIRAYIMCLENQIKLMKRHPKTRKDDSGITSYSKYLKYMDDFFTTYMIKVSSDFQKKNDSDYTGCYAPNLLTNIDGISISTTGLFENIQINLNAFVKPIGKDCNDVYVMILNESYGRTTEITPEMFDNINKLYYALTRNYDGYVCTDSILYKFVYGENGSSHVVFYNMFMNQTQDNHNLKSDVNIMDFKIPDYIRNASSYVEEDDVNPISMQELGRHTSNFVFYIPTLLHFQKIDDDRYGVGNTLQETRFNPHKIKTQHVVAARINKTFKYIDIDKQTWNLHKDHIRSKLMSIKP